MKLKYLGTAAAEGVPAPYCACKACDMARKNGGRLVRTRSGALIDGALKLDYPPDNHCQMLKYGLDFTRLQHVLITHSHMDHLAPEELEMRKPPFGHPPEDVGPLTLYGNARVGELVAPHTSAYVAFREVKLFEPFTAGEYKVTALEAVHAQDEQALFYLIERGGESILYAHDTDEFTDADMRFLAGKKIGLISLDATNGLLEFDYVGHMSISDCLRMRKKLLDSGAADERTVFVLNHFSHNGVGTPEEMAKAADGCLIACDGMEVSTPGEP